MSSIIRLSTLGATHLAERESARKGGVVASEQGVFTLDMEAFVYCNVFAFEKGVFSLETVGEGTHKRHEFGTSCAALCSRGCQLSGAEGRL